jgi:hypothetical protein
MSHYYQSIFYQQITFVINLNNKIMTYSINELKTLADSIQAIRLKMRDKRFSFNPLMIIDEYQKWRVGAEDLLGQYFDKSNQNYQVFISLPREGNCYIVMDYFTQQYPIFNNLIEKIRTGIVTKLPSNNSTSMEVNEKKEKSILNSATFGNHATINIGDNNSIMITNIKIKQGDFGDLKNLLLKYGIENKDVEELGEIIKSDNPDMEKKRFGVGVSNWIGNMVSKAAQNIWNIGIGAAGSLLAQALNSYYGWI